MIVFIVSAGVLRQPCFLKFFGENEFEFRDVDVMTSPEIYILNGRNILVEDDDSFARNILFSK